jgi:hypothetical protein
MILGTFCSGFVLHDCAARRSLTSKLGFVIIHMIFRWFKIWDEHAIVLVPYFAQACCEGEIYAFMLFLLKMSWWWFVRFAEKPNPIFSHLKLQIMMCKLTLKTQHSILQNAHFKKWGHVLLRLFWFLEFRSCCECNYHHWSRTNAFMLKCEIFVWNVFHRMIWSNNISAIK